MTRTIMIDRSFRGVGRICRVTGTTNPVLVKKYNRMLDAFKDDGRIDLLRGIRDGILTFADAYDAYRRGALHELTTAETAKRLSVAWSAWVKVADASDKHRISLAQSGRYLARAGKHARVGDLPRLLTRLRDTIGAKHPRTFNVLRSAVTAFLRDSVTKAHPLYARCVAVAVRTVKKKRKARHVPVEVLRNLFPNRDTDPVDAIAWGMVTSGMGQSEYWGHWSVYADRIHIEGTKREGRVRDVPLVLVPGLPTIHRQTFDVKFRARAARAFTPYDLRRTYASAMEAVGISRTRRRLYMGHESGNVTDLYEHQEVRQFLASDAEKLRAFFDLPPVKSTVTLMPAKAEA